MHCKTTTALLSLAALVGCAETGATVPPGNDTIAVTTTVPVTPVTPVAVAAPATADESLTRLRALEVFRVGEMIVQMPAEAYNCYGPCPGAGPAIARAQQEAVDRLAAFTVRAEQLAQRPVGAARPGEGVCATATVDINLAALTALRVVEVQGMVAAHPTNVAVPYSTPTEADVQAAARTNCDRAERLAAIVGAGRSTR